MTDDPIISTRDKPGTYDALETAKPDELVFTLQSGDPFSVATILFWSDQARTAGRKESKSDIAAKLLRKATDAELAAWAFKDWQDGRGSDVIAEQKRYASEDVTDRNVILARASERLNNALAEAVTVAEKLAALDDGASFGHTCRVIMRVVEDLKEVSAQIEPRRHLRAAN